MIKKQLADVWKASGRRKLLSIALAALMASVAVLPYVRQAEAAGTSVYINGRLASGEVLVRNGTTYLTLTDLKALGDYTFRYSKTWRTITITGEGERFVLTLGSRDARRNGQNITLEAPPLIYENKAMLPVRTAANLLNAKLEWDQNGGRVLITKESDTGSPSSSQGTPSRVPASPSGPSGPTAPKPPTPPSAK
ncbi:copper amine oxidase N-terminal domain-containing protein [Saccharibacillus sp. CPCC 101409]|uniref:copper amine oxidase N-terminal domain-containing protein n=1 Tax=Saccharibacillus sp. CPCC 101409 TaxID=3058041 RepID=UPI002673B029|nr:copper amine oxidase N-terminal domain-containing protein [Saccharibacillus sp. CPCC 101409]MDO3410212.1 copper amine oxidase N-terminal domain-containing protein [Saccharibacillus sp. CPCC 101409]